MFARLTSERTGKSLPKSTALLQLCEHRLRASELSAARWMDSGAVCGCIYPFRLWQNEPPSILLRRRQTATDCGRLIRYALGSSEQVSARSVLSIGGGGGCASLDCKQRVGSAQG